MTIIVMLEFVRRLRVKRLPWWIIHGPVIAWGRSTLLPWFVALRSSVWPVPSGPFNNRTPYFSCNLRLSLLALIGLAIGVAPFGVRRPSDHPSAPARPKTRIIPIRAFIAVSFLCAIYVISLPSLSKFWTLSSHVGANLYSNTNSSFLGLSIVVAGMAIGYAARHQPLSEPELDYISFCSSWCLAPLIDTSSWSSPSLIYSAKPIPARPEDPSPRSRFYSRGQYGRLADRVFRARAAETSFVLGRACPTPLRIHAEDSFLVDVMGSAEYLLEAGARPGQLRGSSYLALPSELIPRAILRSSVDSTRNRAYAKRVWGNNRRERAIVDGGRCDLGAPGRFE